MPTKTRPKPDPDTLRAANKRLSRALARLKESEAKYRHLVEQLPVTTYTAAADSGFTPRFVSPQIVELLGYSLETWRDDPDIFARSIVPEDLERVTQTLARTFETGERFSCEYRIRRADGRVIWVEDEAALVRDDEGRNLCLQGVMCDITERKVREGVEHEQTGHALDVIEQRMLGVINSAMDGIVTIDHRELIVVFNPAAEAMFGYQAAEMIGQPLDRLIPSRFRGVHGQHLRSFVKTGVTSRRMNDLGAIMALRADGDEFPVEASISRTQEQPPLLTVVLRDMTERQRVLDRLTRSELRLARAEELAHLGSYEIDADGLVHASAEAHRILGWPCESPLPTPDDFIAELVHPEDQGQIQESWIGMRRDGLPFDREFRIRRPSGEERVVHSVAQAVRNSDGAIVGAVGSMQDVTDRKRTERLLSEQTTLAALGQMSAVVAHEVKNPLAAVHGVLQILRGRPSVDPGDAIVIDDVMMRLDGLNELLNDILTFARAKPQDIKFSPVPLASLIQDTVSLITSDPALGGVTIVTENLEAACPVSGDRDRLQGVLLNVLMNAAQAMEGSGRVIVSCAPEAGACQLRIRDHGPGMPEAVRQRIFEPFFTTKTRGTGLGMAIAKQNIELHSGGITVECPPEGGTTVTIRFPANVS